MQPSDGAAFEWSGKGVTRFPRDLPEDCLQYSIFLEPTGLKSDARSELHKVAATANHLVERLLGDYIWQQDAFYLEPTRNDGLDSLCGRMSYGDSVEDEWTVVYVLRELSKHHADVWIQVVDTDGEFLLIEAADVLPQWLTPENSENRVWINDGQLKIIPIKNEGAFPQHGASLGVQQALRLGQVQPLLHSSPIEEEAFRRLQNYPLQIQSNQHCALLKVPRKLVLILRENPRSISSAIGAFYLRDPISLRSLQERQGRARAFPPADLVTARVKFNRVGFAQLKSQQFASPAPWPKLSPSADLPARAQSTMGMKLTSAFEMLVADPHNQHQKDSGTVRALLEALDSGCKRLPSDDEIARMGDTEDDEGWMDINFIDLEKEMSGKSKGAALGGFGDQHAQENLRRMAARMEDLLEDDDFETGEDLDGLSGEDATSQQDKADRDISCHEEGSAEESGEEEFTAMMRELMGPGQASEAIEALMGSATRGPCRGDAKEKSEAGSSDEHIRELAAAMEAELREAGVLNQHD